MVALDLGMAEKDDAARMVDAMAVKAFVLRQCGVANPQRRWRRHGHGLLAALLREHREALLAKVLGRGRNRLQDDQCRK